MDELLYLLNIFDLFIENQHQNLRAKEQIIDGTRYFTVLGEIRLFLSTKQDTIHLISYYSDRA